MLGKGVNLVPWVSVLGCRLCRFQPCLKFEGAVRPFHLPFVPSGIISFCTQDVSFTVIEIRECSKVCGLLQFLLSKLPPSPLFGGSAICHDKHWAGFASAVPTWSDSVPHWGGRRYCDKIILINKYLTSQWICFDYQKHYRVITLLINRFLTWSCLPLLYYPAFVVICHSFNTALHLISLLYVPT